MTRKKRYTAKTRGRIMILFSFFCVIIATLGYTLFFNVKQISDFEKEKKNLKKEQLELKDEESAISADIKRLSEEEYIARFAREKYYYSKDGELVLKMDEK